MLGSRAASSHSSKSLRFIALPTVTIAKGKPPHSSQNLLCHRVHCGDDSITSPAGLFSKHQDSCSDRTPNSMIFVDSILCSFYYLILLLESLNVPTLVNTVAKLTPNWLNKALSNFSQDGKQNFHG